MYINVDIHHAAFPQAYSVDGDFTGKKQSSSPIGEIWSLSMVTAIIVGCLQQLGPYIKKTSHYMSCTDPC